MATTGTRLSTRLPRAETGRFAWLATSPLRYLDVALVGSTIAISALGLLMIYSSTHERLRTQGIDELYYVKRQGVSMLIGLALMAALLAIDYRKLRDYAVLVYGVTIALLFAVLTPLGSNARGSQSWFQLPGGFQLQPAELAKFGIIVALAGYLHSHRGEMDPWKLTVTLALGAAPIALVMLQPDLGTVMVLGLIVITMLAVGGAKLTHLLVLGLFAATFVAAIVGLGLLQDYQVDRLAAFTGGGDETTTYNTEQSKIAIGAGGVLGQGFDNGDQTGGGFVPEQHTDFIFTAVGEELGFVGAATLLVLFAVVMWRTWRAALLARDVFGTLVCAGVLAMFAFQSFENMGMTMGIMPVTGIPLPFMSYGGSSTITSFACIALVANVHMRRFS